MHMNVDHRMRNQHIPLNGLGTTLSVGVDENHSRDALCACAAVKTGAMYSYDLLGNVCCFNSSP